MRTPVVDYRQLRLGNITSPQYRHLLLLSGWIVYFVLFFLTENLIPAESCYPVWCVLDDYIPFNEWFVIPYVGWYLLIAWSLLYFLFYNVENFKGLQTYIIVTQAIAMVCYIVFPTRQDLRPEVFERDNVLTGIMGFMYTIDTNTGVCPSLHVAYSLGIASTFLKEEQASKWTKAFVLVFVALVCMSITFTKQHSAVDFFTAIPVGIVAEMVAFYKQYWKRKKLLKNVK